MHKDLEEISRMLKIISTRTCSIQDAEIVLSKVCQETTEKSRIQKNLEYMLRKLEMEKEFASLLESIVANCREEHCEKCLISKWCNSYRKQQQELEQEREALVYADFFCGAGGSGRGEQESNRR